MFCVWLMNQCMIHQGNWLIFTVYMFNHTNTATLMWTIVIKSGWFWGTLFSDRPNWGYLKWRIPLWRLISPKIAKYCKAEALEGPGKTQEKAYFSMAELELITVGRVLDVRHNMSLMPSECQISNRNCIGWIVAPIERVVCFFIFIFDRIDTISVSVATATKPAHL